MSDAILDDPMYDTALAIIGMAGRFPGADDVEAFWRNITEGVISIREFSEEELLAAGCDAGLIKHPQYVNAGTTLSEIASFDASFFGFAPNEAMYMDPQHRLFLECAWEALEHAGYIPGQMNELVGVFAGSHTSDYLQYNLASRTDLQDAVNKLMLFTGNDCDSLASLVAYKLNLKGPSISVQTYCSTSLVATHLACQSLLTYECDLALAGGVAITLPHPGGYLYEEGGMLSPDGRCCTFDGNSKGSVIGNGLGIVVLKRFKEALEDGDMIYAVIRGSAVNNDGGVRVGYTAPGRAGQSAVIADAISRSGIPFESIGYIEAHGTGTQMGDAIELSALINAFAPQTQKRQFCALGSVKPNIGHLDRAAGVTGLIKTALALYHKQLPPTPNFERTSSDIDLPQTPFYVNTQLRAWKSDGTTPRRAGVNSFGLGGTNVHVVLEEAPVRIPSSEERSWYLLPLAARSDHALQKMVWRLADHLAAHPELSLADVAYTLQIGRAPFLCRKAIICRDMADAIERLRSEEACTQSQRNEGKFHLAWMFSDNAQVFLAGVARTLYKQEKAFCDAVEQCCEIISRRFQKDLRLLFLSGESSLEGTDRLSALQVATVIFQISLAEMWRAWGVEPQAVSGSGLGLYGALFASGICSREDVLSLAFEQARQEILQGTKIAPMVAQEQLAQRLSRIVRQSPQLPVLFSVESGWVTAAQVRDTRVLARMLTESGSESELIAKLRSEGNYHLLEVGVGARERLGKSKGVSVVGEREDEGLISPWLSGEVEEEQAYKGLLEALAWLWQQGMKLNWQRFSAREKRFRVPLPTYPFERERFWIEPAAPQQSPNELLACPQIPLSPMEAVLAEEPERKADIADWFSCLSWRQSCTQVPFPSDERLCWLLLIDDCGIGLRLREELLRHQQTVITIVPGTEFARLDAQSYSVRPAIQADFIALLKMLRAQGETPQKVVHLWMVTREESEMLSEEALNAACEHGFASLLALIQALSDVSLTACEVAILSTGVQEVLGSEKLSPEKALIMGPCNVIGQEYTQIACRSIDIVLPEQGSREEELLIEAVLGEVTNPSEERVVALRNHYRWVRTVEPLHLENRSGAASVWRTGGVYLITGGLGGIGLALADYLIKSVGARVILTTRSALPPRASWNAMLQECGDAGGIGYRIRQMQALEAAGGQVLVLQADVTDEMQMRTVIDQVISTFGALHGVFHLAALPPSGLIQLKTPEMAAQVMHPKLWGTLVLERVTKHLPLDFLVLFSSTSAIVGGGPGQVDYSAANAFLDLYARARRNERRKTIALNWGEWLWDAWSEGLEGFPNEVRAYFQMKREKFGISFADGMEALTKALARGLPQLTITTQDFAAQLEGSRQLSIATIVDRLQSMRKSQPAAARPELETPYVAPERAIERKIADLWSQLLGIEQIGINDNFFQLGGHSLIGTQLILSLREEFQVELPLVTIFEASTVAELALEIELLLLDEVEGMSEEEVERAALAR